MPGPASFAPVIYSVGTTGVLILPNHGKRTQYSIIFPASSKVSGNTGIVYIGIGFVPNPTGGSTAQGHPMANGEIFGETSNYKEDKVSQGEIYAIASTSTQIIEVYEVVD